MNVTDEELAAFADGELAGADAARVAAAVEADPALAKVIEQHRALRATLGRHFAPILEQEVPARLSSAFESGDNVVPFARPQPPKAKPVFPRWGWVAAPALAASLAIAVFVPREGTVPPGYAGAELAAILDSQLVAEQDEGSGTRILLSFRREDGDYCRVFASPGQSGIACRDDSGWALVEAAGGITAEGGEYRQAGSEAELMAAAQDMAAGGALDAEAERRARDSGWRD